MYRRKHIESVFETSDHALDYVNRNLDYIIQGVNYVIQVMD